MISRVEAPIDEGQKHWDLVEIFECGFERFAGTIHRPCPTDPDFPSLSDYDLVCQQEQGGKEDEWYCHAFPKTEMARKVSLQTGCGQSAEIAKGQVKANYLYQAGHITHQEYYGIHSKRSL